MAEADIVLELNNISKEFPGVKALQGVSLKVKRGSVHALMGENGAGKSTLMKCLFGIYTPDGGEMKLDGHPISFRNPREALEHGVAMVHQELNQALQRNVMDNMWLGRYPTRWYVFTSEKELYNKTAEVLRQLDLKIDPTRQMSTMSVAERQMVEIAKAVSFGARVIVLDEPTSSLTEEEVAHLFRIIQALKEKGCAIIYISHKMEEILTICDEITVMRDGTLVDTRPTSEMTMDKIIRLMVGRELSERFPPKNRSKGKTVLELCGLTSRYTKVKDASLTVARGEIVGIAGLAGAGRSELLENLFGISARAGGEILLEGRVISNKNARDAIGAGFALLTEERRATGIFGILNICENTTVSALPRFCALKFFIKDKARKSATADMIKRLRVRTASQRVQIRTLSGGNQQKVILARWLLTSPSVLLLDEPTRGIDVGAKYEIYRLMGELAANGKAIIMVSGELPELLGVCHRIYVMSNGSISGVVDADHTSQEEIMALAAKNL